jgi:serine/threonine-protein kinase RsbW
MSEAASGMEELVLASELEVLDRVDAATLRCAREAGLDEGLSTDVAIAVIEAVTNAVVHGNRFGGDKRVRVKFDWEPGKIWITVHDEGIGFDLSTIPDPTDPQRFMACAGRGIYIMKQVMDSVEFDMNSGGGTTVTMSKST